MADHDSAILLRLDTPEPVKLWGGTGLFELAADDEFDPAGIYNQLDPNGAWISSLPVMRQLIGGTAEALDFVFSGVPAIPQSWVDSGSAIGYRLTLGLLFLDADVQQDGPAWWIWSGIARMAAADDSETTATITLTAETTCGTRSRAALKTWTNASHHQRHPTDDFCKRVGRNGLNNVLKWG